MHLTAENAETAEGTFFWLFSAFAAVKDVLSSWLKAGLRLHDWDDFNFGIDKAGGIIQNYFLAAASKRTGQSQACRP